MRILHTGDWHVGKTLRGRSRADEHRTVLAEIAELTVRLEIDLVIVAGDLFDSAAPTAESERIVYRALIDLTAGGACLVVVAGNHDNPRRLQAVTPLLELASVHVASVLARPEDGGVRRIETRSGETATVACLPFLTQRGIVKADDLMRGDAADHSAAYAQRTASIVAALTDGMSADTVKLLVAHAMVHGGVLGGGERSAHTVFDYSLPATAFPASLHYVALGHLHRVQAIPGACPVWFCGSPLQLDFSEATDAKCVNVVEALAGRPARIESVPLTAGRKLRTVRGSLARLETLAGTTDDDHLRIEVEAPATPGLADRIRELFPEAVDVRVGDPGAGSQGTDASRPVLSNRAPQELFADYLRSRGESVEALGELFTELLEEVHAPGAA